ncbi:MAG: NADH-quinone oxidoreductase subunit C [Polyangiales bacterium]
MQPKAIFDRIQKQFGEEVVFDWHADPKKDKDPWCQLQPYRVDEVCRALRDDPETRFDWLECLTGVDYPDKSQIHVIYHLYSYSHKHRFIFKCFLDRADPSISTLNDVWKTANWHERETFDLLGVIFEGHPDLRRLLLPDDWEGHPMRKDFVEQADYHGIPTVRPNPLDLFKITLPEKGKA